MCYVQNTMSGSPLCEEGEEGLLAALARPDNLKPIASLGVPPGLGRSMSSRALVVALHLDLQHISFVISIIITNVL